MISKSSIFVASNSANSRQMIIFSQLDANETKIIPVPNPHSVQFHNMTKMPDFFENVSDSFLVQWSKNKHKLKKQKKWKHQVHAFNIGGYNVSVISRLSDLFQIKKDLDKNTENVLNECYQGSNWGFIVFQPMNPMPQEYNCFAYSHDIVNNQFFIPTKLLLGGKEKRNYFQKILDSLTLNHNNKEWSLDIYLFNCGESNLLSEFSSDWKYLFTDRIHFDRNAIDFDLSQCNSFYKYTIQGMYPDMDITFR